MNVIRSTVGLIVQNEPDANKWRGIIVNTAGVEGVRGTSAQACIAAASGAILGNKTILNFIQGNAHPMSIPDLFA